MSEQSPFEKAVEDAAKPKGLTLRRMSDVQSRPTEWLEIGKLPLAEHVLLVGHGGLGKSTYTLHVAAEVTNGTMLGEYFGKPKDVIIFIAEDSTESTVKPRLQAAGADLTRVHIVVVPNGEPDEGASRLVKLKDELDDIDVTLSSGDLDVGLIIFDPLVSFMSGSELHKEGEVRDILTPLGALARKHMITVMSIMHFNKGSGSSSYTRIANSAAFRNAVRVVLIWGQPEGAGVDDRVLVWDKFNVGRKPDAETWRIAETRVTFDQPNRRGDVKEAEMSYVVRTGTARVTSDELIAPSLAHNAPKRAQAMDVIEDTMDGASWVMSAVLEDAAKAHSITIGSTWQDAKKALGLDTVKLGHQGEWATYNPKLIDKEDARTQAQGARSEHGQQTL